MTSEIIIPEECRSVKLVFGYSVKTYGDGVIVEFLHYDHIDNKTYVIGRFYIPVKIFEDFIKTLQEAYNKLKEG